MSAEPPSPRRSVGIELARHLQPMLPHPVIADMNALFQDVQRHRKVAFTGLGFLARHEAITLLTSEHVRTALPERILAKSSAPAADTLVWRRDYLPFVRFVHVPDDMCAGHPQVEAITDPEDRPFARLAIATAPSLLLTRDHHLLDVGLATTDRWAETMTILGSLIELDAAIYGTAHSALLLARLLGALASGAWRLVEAEPLLALALAGLAALYVALNPEQTLARLRSLNANLRTQASRLLESSAPAFDRRERLAGELSLRLLAPMLPRTLDRGCARELATRRTPLLTDHLLLACSASGRPSVSAAQLEAMLHRHPSFTPPGNGSWQLGELGLPVLEA